MKRTLLLISVCLILQGCACWYIKTPEFTACYCRAGSQKVSVDEEGLKQESDGTTPSGLLGSLIELLAK